MRYNSGKREIIRLMYNAGESVEKISKYTGYEVEELENLLKEFRI